MTGQDLVDRVKPVGFDNTDDEILAWADERQKEMVAAARARRERVAVGNTVADQASYAMPAGIVEIYEVTVGGSPYGRSPHTDIAQANQADLVWVGNGLYVADADSSAVDKITLIPTPEESGTAIEIYAAIRPVTLTLAGTVFIPDEFVRYLRYGMLASGWDENAEDTGTAERFEQRFEQGVERYRRWVARRFRGSGPAQIRVKGFNA